MSDRRQVLITGGAGFIGSHLAVALINQGHCVRIIDDFSNGLQSNIDLVSETGDKAGLPVMLFTDTILDQDALDHAAQGCDTIFHLAAVSNVKQTLDDPVGAHDVNATGTLRVLEAARRYHAHVVYSSSAAVYGDTPDHPKCESGATDPLSLYGSQKLLGEFYLKQYGALFGVTGVSLRYFNVYGERQRPDSPYSGVISVFVDRAMANKPIVIHGDGSQTRDFVHVSDVVQANIAASDARTLRGGIVNVCTGTETSIAALAQSVVKATGAEIEISNGPRREGDILQSLGNTRQALSSIGFSAETIFDDGLKQLVDSLRH